MDSSDIFSFFCSGEGKGESEAPGRGHDFFLIVPGGGVSRGWGRGEGVFVEFFGGGGAKYLFFEIPTKSST